MLDEDLIKIFSRSALYDSILLNREGIPILASHAKLAMLDSGASYGDVFEHVVTNGVRSGVREIDSKSGKMIYAFTKIAFGQLIVVSEISRDKAFLASKQLVKRSILFAILVFLIGSIAGRIFIGRLTSSLRDLFTATLRIAQGNFESPVLPATRDEIGALGHSFNYMTQMIRQLLSATADKARMEKELETAQAVQSYLLPAENRKTGQLGVFPFYRSASETGGDWWGHFVISPHEELVLLGDVVGHGVSAALVTAMIHSACSLEVDRLKDSGERLDLAEFLMRLNRILFGSMSSRMCMTLFAAQINTSTNKIIYSNAGHVSPFLLPRSSEDQRLKSGRRFVTILAPSDPLGISQVPTYHNVELSLVDGDRILIFSDGLFECQSNKGAPWGRRNLQKAVEGLAEMNGAELCQQLINQAFTYFADHPLDDDVSLVVLEIQKSVDASEVGGKTEPLQQSA